MHLVVQPIANVYNSWLPASLLHVLPHGIPSALGFLERNDFLLDSYIVIFAFHRLHTAQYLLRNFLQYERPSSLEALVAFENVRSLNLFVLAHIFINGQSFSDLDQLHIQCLSLDLQFNEFGCLETVSGRQLVDLLPSMMCDV
ncbi:hypothetical protein RF11_09357 [Thelohanellus kitauei]|uniref:Uncharacterized protein n=1 Tax=Thelohanellus kitauei TaxID=669202 RepID=A0A0C2I905_THEKT|nr:hypothetical protein RF11_09357 [Thelohanellus kitauei]